MTSPREIKKRINSVQSTKKITRTMELVATAKSKKSIDLLNASQPFTFKIFDLIESLLSSKKVSKNHPLLRVSNESTQHIVLFVIAANRGLCGSFNTTVIKKGMDRYQELKKSGKKVELHLAGKKAVSAFQYAGIEPDFIYTDIEKNSPFEVAQNISEEFIQKFSNKNTDKIETIYTCYRSSTLQEAVNEILLPLSLEKNKNEVADFIFEPSPEDILNNLLPRSIHVKIYEILLYSMASEQIARRIAMKNATDAAGEMIKSMNLIYNRARQAKITQEIAEIVGGCEAIQ